MRKKTSDLAIIGSYPPPYGGVTTHSLRLRALMDEAGISYTIYNASSDAEDPPGVQTIYRNRARWLISYFFTGKEPVVYIMSRNRVLWLYGALLAIFRGKKVVLRLQCAQLLDWKKAGSPKYRLAGWIFRRMYGIVSVNRHLQASVRELGVAEDRSWWFPGFLPPAEWERDPAEVAPQMLRFAQGKSPFIPVTGRVLFQHGIDLYGLDLMVELADRLKPDYPNLGIGICAWGSDEEDEHYLARLEARIRELGVEDNILITTQQGLFVPLLFMADISLRPTNSDGDANSLREALFLGVPAVASDVTERPQGCYIFRNRDLDDFEAKTRLALEKGMPEGNPGSDRLKLTHARPYLEMLSGLVAETRSQNKTAKS